MPIDNQQVKRSISRFSRFLQEKKLSTRTRAYIRLSVTPMLQPHAPLSYPVHYRMSNKSHSQGL